MTASITSGVDTTDQPRVFSPEELEPVIENISRPGQPVAEGDRYRITHHEARNGALVVSCVEERDYIDPGTPEPAPTHRHLVTLDEFKRLIMAVNVSALSDLRQLAKTDPNVHNLFEWLEAKRDPLDLHSEDASIWFAYMYMPAPDGIAFFTEAEVNFIAQGVPL